MAYINSSTHSNFVELYIETLPDIAVDEIFDKDKRATTIISKLGDPGSEYQEGAELGMMVPALTEVTVNATPGLYRWKQLDELSEFVITTASTNSLGMSLVVDPESFFGDPAADPEAEDIKSAGIFQTTNNKHLVCFRLYWSGNTPEADPGYYVEGVGYLAGLAPTTNPDAPVWVSPVTIEVAGDYTTGSIDPTVTGG
jgi:hypothetical protein